VRAQGRRATRLRYAPTVTAVIILKQFPTLLHVPGRIWQVREASIATSLVVQPSLQGGYSGAGFGIWGSEAIMVESQIHVSA
jgi:hypothetical protein